MKPFLENEDQDFEINPELTVLQDEDRKAFLSAEELIESAKAKAEDMGRQAQEAFEAEKIRGYEEGMNTLKREMATKFHELNMLRCQYHKDMEQHMSSIVEQVVRKLVDQIPDADLTMDLARSALKQGYLDKRIVLKVPETQLDEIKAKVDELIQNANLDALEIVASPDLTRGQCILEDNLGGIVDADLDLQLEALRDAIRKSFASK